VEPDFIHRANIDRFEQLLASGTLSATQTAMVTALLGKEMEALDQLTKPSGPKPNPPAAPQ